jgi:hypothetical protein
MHMLVHDDRVFKDTEGYCMRCLDRGRRLPYDG